MRTEGTSEEQPEYRGEALAARSVIGGILMGLANLVPGISGGTMLLATGVYPQFIHGVAEVSTFRFRPRSVLTLACIVISALVAFLAFAGPVSGLVILHRWVMYSLFIGLTLGGVPVLWRMLRPVDAGVVVAAVVGIACMALLAFVQPEPAEGSRGYLFAFIAGLAGASAMVLPGVSGGYLLLLLGQYVTILTAVAAFKNGLTAGDWAAVSGTLHTIVPVGLGVLVGVVGVSNLIKVLLDRFERATLGVLLGLLLGAIIGLWPFQEGRPPEVGTIFRGDTVVVVDGELTMEQAGREIKPSAWETAFFTPSTGQAAAACGLIIVGFATSFGIALIGGGDRKQDQGGPSDR
ncbi:MAG: DUF368 domain-containing protein [Planctomycetes bacterium]|nr:DUF368 domain-containing protein [Planctomycetota bacterium]